MFQLKVRICDTKADKCWRNMNESRFGFRQKMLYLCTTRRKQRCFLLFWAQKWQKWPQRSFKFLQTSEEGPLMSFLLSRVSSILPSILPQKTSILRKIQSFWKKCFFVKQNKEQLIFSCGCCRGHFMSARTLRGVILSRYFILSMLHRCFWLAQWVASDVETSHWGVSLFN